MEADRPSLLTAVAPELSKIREHIVRISLPSVTPLTPWETVEPEAEGVEIEEQSKSAEACHPEPYPAKDLASSGKPDASRSTTQHDIQATISAVQTEVQSLIEPPRIDPAPKAFSSPDALMVAPTDVAASESIDEEETDEIPPPPKPESAKPKPSGGGLFTIPLLCLGIGLIACCILIPAADENHHLVYEREKLKLDLDQISHQIDVNDEFLKRIADDPSLSERLAQRQMKMVRQGTSVLDLKIDDTDKQMSPFGLLTLPPPEPLPPYQPIGGMLSTVCRNPHGQLYMTGAGLLMIAMGLVLGHTPVDPTVSSGDGEESETESIGD
jgi:hypothetical protein